MQKFNIDITILIDEERIKRCPALLCSSEGISQAWLLCGITTNETSGTTRHIKYKRVGEQMILAQPTWGGTIIKSSSERSGLGILTATTIRAATTDILLLDNYWPIPNNNDEQYQSLTAHLQHCLKKKEKKYRGSPLEWIKDFLKNTDKHMYTSRRLQFTLVSGQRRHQRTNTDMGNTK